MAVLVVKCGTLPIQGLDQLIVESNGEGFLFLNRLVDEWRSGANRFDVAGEVLFQAYRQRKLVGVCGLNVDPYAHDPAIGRVRHLFVSRAHRRSAVGRQLIEAVLREGRKTFRALRLRTDATGADAFYRRLGFRRLCGAEDATHCMTT